MSNENVPLLCISLEYQSHILSQRVEGVRCSYVWRWACSVTCQIWGDHLIPESGKEVQLAPPDIQRPAHPVDEKQSNISMCSFTACYPPLTVNYYCALRLPPSFPGLLRLLGLYFSSRLSCWTSFGCAVVSSCERLWPSLWDADRRWGVAAVCQFNLHSAVGFSLSVLADFQLRACPLAQVLNEQLSVAVDCDLSFAAHDPTHRGLLKHRSVRDDVSNPQDTAWFHLHELVPVCRLRGFHGNHGVGRFGGEAAEKAFNKAGQHGCQSGRKKTEKNINDEKVTH